MLNQASPYFCGSIMRMKLQALWLLLLVIGFSACNDNQPDVPSDGSNLNPPPPIINYSVVKIYPHDTTSFLEGLEFYNGILYAGTGSPQNYPYPSWLGTVDLNSGKLKPLVTLDTQYFGEGITVFKDKIYQLTYTTRKGFVYDAKTMKKLQEFTYNTEGWGMTHDSTSLIMSDGGSNLYYLDPVTLQNTKILGVTDNNGPVSNINELEYVDGFIYANQWQTPYILKIDAASGKVVGKLDLSTLAHEIDTIYKDHEYLNGIAYNPDSKTFFVTGKRWPRLYEIKF
jgi:glutaminyl-peptide cyclotransferase